MSAQGEALAKGLNPGLGKSRSCAVERHDPPGWNTPAIWNRVLGENLK